MPSDSLERQIKVPLRASCGSLGRRDQSRRDCWSGPPPATPTDTATATVRPGDAALWRRRPWPPSTVSHECLSCKHESGSLAGIARTAASGQRQPSRARPRHTCANTKAGLAMGFAKRRANRQQRGRRRRQAVRRRDRSARSSAFSRKQGGQRRTPPTEPGDPQCSRAGLRASRGPDALCAESEHEQPQSDLNVALGVPSGLPGSEERVAGAPGRRGRGYAVSLVAVGLGGSPIAFSMRFAWRSISSAQASTISMSASSWLQEVR